MLSRGRREPVIWPFESQEMAEDWALEHGCLDWRAEPMTDRPEHEAICGRCREPWPCEHVRLDRKAAAIIRASEEICARCGKRVGWKEVRIAGGGLLGEDIKFHGRKGACRNEGLRRLNALATPAADAERKRLESEAHYELRAKEWRERHRAEERAALRLVLNAEAEGEAA
jgi:hypothetical protein